MDRHPVKSSNLKAIGYDPELRILEVEFWPNRMGDGAVWQYDNVDAEAYEALCTSESVGKKFMAMRDSLKGRRVGTVRADDAEIACT